MKIIDAWWEKKNLDMSTQEILVSQDDDFDAFIKAVNSLSAKYQVIKIPTENHNLILECQKLGFKFVETMCHLSFKIDRDIVLGSGISYRRASPEDMELICSNIKDEMFITDRICIDPFFTKEIAGRRYINWIKDELEKKAVILTMLCNDIEAGFSCLSVKEDGYQEFLYGIFKSHQGKGLARNIIDCAGHYASSKGARSLDTSVSANNIKSLKAHISYGFRIDALRYVFVKHLQENK